MPRYFSSYDSSNWQDNWKTLTKDRLSDSSWRATEAMEVPDGVIMMTTVVIPGNSTAINTMFIPRVKIQGKRLVSM